MRIGDVSRQAASKQLATLLNDKFKRDLRQYHKFSDGFAMMNLQWEDYKPKQAPIHGEPTATVEGG